MKMTIAKKFLSIIVSVSFLIITLMVINWVTVKKAVKNAEKIKTGGIVYSIMAKDMQLSILQVQQWLTDISATRASEGYADGFDEAKEQANIFRQYYKKFYDKYEQDNNRVALMELEKISSDFDSYYEMGKKMAAAYINGGPEEGNKMMDEFDGYAERLTDSFQPFAEKQIKLIDNDLQTVSLSIKRGRNLTLMVGLAILVVIAAILAVIFLHVKDSMGKIMAYVDSLSKGDLSSLLVTDLNDEFGTLIRSLNKMCENLNTRFKDIVSGVQNVKSSSGDLTSLSVQMSEETLEASNRSSSIASASGEVDNSINSVSASMEELSTNMNIVATSTEEMNSTVNEISSNTEKARVITDESVTNAKTASEKVEELGKAAIDIGNVTETINDISEQTNLLALNATIEAARAGEAGKGFAVVANEIKELARQTADATKEIKRQIESIQGVAESTASEIEQIAKVINEVNDLVSTIAASVEEQSVTTSQIAENVGQASNGIKEVTQNVSQTSTFFSEIANDIEQVNRVVGDLSKGGQTVKTNSGALEDMAKNLDKTVAMFKLLKENSRQPNSYSAHNEQNINAKKEESSSPW